MAVGECEGAAASKKRKRWNKFWHNVDI